MGTKKIILKSSDYKYPTKDERIMANKICPLIKSFGFEYKNEIQLFLQDKYKFGEVKREVDLFQWDCCLLNKLGKLQETLVYLNTNYLRGQNDIANEQPINDYLFDYYTEIYYYYFFSSRDLIAQILNVYTDLNFHEDKVSLNKIASKIINPVIKELILNFSSSNSIKIANDFRNAFTHKFPSNYADYRGTVSMLNGVTTYGVGRGNLINSNDIIENIIDSQKILKEFIDSLRVQFRITPANPVL
jgi:hypothetical protein